MRSFVLAIEIKKDLLAFYLYEIKNLFSKTFLRNIHHELI